MMRTSAACEGMMPVRDLREWIEHADEVGEPTRAVGANPEYEPKLDSRGLSQGWASTARTDRRAFSPLGRPRLDENSYATDEEIRAYLSVDLGRCGSYVKILDSIREAIAQLRTFQQLAVPQHRQLWC